nr:hypothetical protein [Tanacetum cinerariifolium]
MSDTQLGKWKKGEKGATPIEAPVLMISQKGHILKKRPIKEDHSNVGSLRVDLKIPIVSFSGEHSWPLGEVPLDITIREGSLTSTKVLNFVIVRSDSTNNLLLGRTTMQQMGIIVSTIHEAIKFHTPRGIGIILSEYNPYRTDKGQEETNKTSKEGMKDILSCVDVEKRIIINNQYLEQIIAIGRQLSTNTKIKLQDLLKANADFFAWTTAYLTGVSKTIMVRGEPFNTEHIMNEFKHIDLLKQKKRSLVLERNEAIRVKVE